jgi:hypothetical protein
MLIPRSFLFHSIATRCAFGTACLISSRRLVARAAALSEIAGDVATRVRQAVFKVRLGLRQTSERQRVHTTAVENAGRGRVRCGSSLAGCRGPAQASFADVLHSYVQMPVYKAIGQVVLTDET